MNDTAFLLFPEFKKRGKKKKEDDPLDFQAKRANRPFIFLGLIFWEGPGYATDYSPFTFLKEVASMHTGN